MKKKLLLIPLFFMCLFFLQLSAFAQKGISYPINKTKPRLVIYESGKVENYKVLAQNRRKSGEKPRANFEVTYHGFSDDARAAFQQAVDLWSFLITSTVPIKIDATWEELDEGVLGAAGASSYRRDFNNVPYDSVWYPMALANKLAGFDIDEEIPDIEARFSSKANWYLGIDGNCPSFRHDFLSVVMHEIGHGLGFASSADVERSFGEWGLETGFPFIYDIFMYNGDNEQIIDTNLFKNHSIALKNQYVSGNIFFDSELSNSANNGEKVELFAPIVWNKGSSISHLGESFNESENSMMTYSVGTGEVFHHPGPITLSMFAELGWTNVLFKPKKIKDMEEMLIPQVFEVEIFSDSSLINGSVFLHYSTDGFITDNKILLKSSNGAAYSASIPVISTGTVSYYFEASTILNRTYYHPRQRTLEGPIQNTLSFYVGADTVAPVIEHEPQVSIFNFDKELVINFGSNDNLGLETTFVEFKANDEILDKVACRQVSYSESTDLFNFETSIFIGDLQDSDTLYYRIIAHDIAQVSNTTISPSEGFYKVIILALGTPIVEGFIDFDEAGDKDLFIGSGLNIAQPEGFDSKGLHSPHPYLEGDPFPTDEINYTSFLKTPIIVKEVGAYLRFDEVVIVEPGADDSYYGHPDFWDYVVVEGSVDNAKTWYNFGDGYDSNISFEFKKAFNDVLSGDESMYRSHKINLLANENIKGNDVILIRFRLYSDQLSAGWGWAIDNLEIQPDLSSIENTDQISQFDVYPNPSNGSFELSIRLNEPIDEYEFSIHSILGERIFQESNVASSTSITQRIDISNSKPGVYFVKLNYGRKSLSKKIVVK